MKTAKEKAEELVLKYLRIDNNTKEWFNTHIAKQCALISVDLIIYHTEQDSSNIPLYEYYLEVKQEIKNIS